ncbi:MAG: hypothetical protein QM619_00650 [Micropruina sp.]|uniref:hypothetical protein n=1 Tax=Micropruina sp. TaxID=2737536 RepID=UPI0039E2BACA
MADDPFSDRSELEDALRRHFRAEVDRTDFRPLTVEELSAAEPAKAPSRRSRWLLGAAAAVVTVGVAVQVVVGQLSQSPVNGIPATVSASGTPGGTATAPLWTPRLPAPVDVGRYAQVTVDGAVYLLAGRAEDGSCRLDAYRYQPGPDLWQRLADGPGRPRTACAETWAFASGSRIYLMVDGGSGAGASRMELYSYDTGDDAWARLTGPALPDDAGCTPLGMDYGIFCLDGTGSGAAPIGFHSFDFAGRRWTTGEAQLAGGQTRLSVRAHRVSLPGGERVLLDARLPGGGISLVTWDPATGTLDDPIGHRGTGTDLGVAQITGDGWVYANPPTDPAALGIAGDDPRATTGLAVNLATQSWHTVVVPHPAGPLATALPSDAGWALRYYGAQASGYVDANHYLYRPGQQSWLAIGPLPPPGAGGGEYGWVGNVLRCQSDAPRNCWGLTVRSLSEVARPLDQAAIDSSNAQVR